MKQHQRTTVCGRAVEPGVSIRSIICNFTTIASLSLVLAACGGSDNAGRDVNAGAIAAAAAQNATGNAALHTEIVGRPSRQPLVVNGSVVEHHRYPWMAAVVAAGEPNASFGQYCGGSLIAEKWVLTAAHCVENENANGTAVLLGQRNLNDGNGERIQVQRIIVHPDYASNDYPDLALLELSTASKAPLISLPSQNNPAPADGEEAIVIGWGQISENGPASNSLLETSMNIVDHDTCNRAYGNQIDQTSMVCAGTPSGDSDSCYGDSGGPLFVKRESEYVQAGVVSFGEACGLPGVPGVYARVSSYYDWISAYAPVRPYNQSGNVMSVDAVTSIEEPATTPEESTAPVDTDEESTFNPEEETFEQDEEFLMHPEDALDIEEGFDFNTEDALDEDEAFFFGSEDELYEFDESFFGFEEGMHEWDEFFGSEEAVDNPEVVAESGGNWNFDGVIRHWYDVAFLPDDYNTIDMPDGKLALEITTNADEPMLLLVDEYDPQTRNWYLIAEVETDEGVGQAVLDLPQGQYAFTVLSLGNGGNFTLNAQHSE